VHYDGSISSININGCTRNAPEMLPSNGAEGLPMTRFFWDAAQAAGFGYMPFDLLQRITIGAPYRSMFQLFSQQKGQDRSNFISPTYSIGFSGEDTTSTPTDINVVARLAGAPVGTVPIVNNGVAGATSFVRLFSENNDDPFYRKSRLAPAGDNKQVLARLVCTQYTSFLTGTKNMPLTAAAGAWNTNLILPLNTDAIYADGFQLPVTIDSNYAIPPTSIFTIRHGDSSIVVRILRADRSAASNIVR
jgi:hypothetical protein